MKTRETPEEGTSRHEVDSGNKLVAFFRDTWAPLMIKLRFLVVLIFLGVFVAACVIVTGLEPDENPPNTLPDDNNYVRYQEVVVDNFARAGNPYALKVLWVSGLNPDDPIDRSGTSRTNTTDYGTPNHVDCSKYDPASPDAIVWGLNTCHDMFFSNVTAYHG